MAVDPTGERGWNTTDSEALRRLDDELDAIGPGTLRWFWALQSLITVDAVIRNRPPDEVAHQLGIAESRL